MNAAAALSATREDLIRENDLHEACIAQLSARLEKSEHELAWLKRQLFGAKSERFNPNEQQTSLELGAVTKSEPPSTTQQVTYERSTTKPSPNGGHGRGEMPTHLPFVDTTIEPDEDVSGCEHIGTEVSWEYEYEPGRLVVHRFMRPKYVRANGAGVAIGALPPRAIERGNAGPGLMARVVIDKYLYHIPLDRQRTRFGSEHQVEFAESTLCDMVRQAVFWMEPLYERMKVEIVKASYVQADETTIPVLVRDGRGHTHKGYYWVYHDPVGKLVVFEYRSGRGREGPNTFLRDFAGVLQVDAYTGYDELAARPDVTRAGCMAHVRRKFEEALESDSVNATYALETIRPWFLAERAASERGLSTAERLTMRQGTIAPSMDAFRGWLLAQCQDQLPKAPLRKAAEYALGQWSAFTSYLTDGRIELSNNLVENAIRPIAIGRKNYLFKGSEAAAQRGAVTYSLLATANLHGIEPLSYVKDLLTKLPGEKDSAVEQYLPHRWNPAQ
jgi:transposase